MTGSSQSALEYVLSIVVKPLNVIKKILTNPKFGSKKIVLVIAFRISLKLDVKIVWLGCQVAVCVIKRT